MLELKPVDRCLLAWEQQWAEEITPKEFFRHLYNSLRKRWELMGQPLPLNPPLPSLANRECQSCGNMVEQNTHGNCPICGYHHLIYIGHSQVLPTVEHPHVMYWGKSGKKVASA
jgi:hypothetical protein